MKKLFYHVLVVVSILSIFTLCLNIGCARETHARVKAGPSYKLVRPGGDLQAVLDSGDDLLLERRGVYEISETLVYKFPNQKISTKESRRYCWTRRSNKRIKGGSRCQ